MALALVAAGGCRTAQDDIVGESHSDANSAGAAPVATAPPKRPQPVIQVLGVHPVPGQSDVVLIEVRIDRPPGEVKPEEFTQEDLNLPRYDWQVGFDEHYLSEDGKTIVGDFLSRPAGAKRTRMAFFFRQCAANLPLLTPGGAVPLPHPTPMPPRLKPIQYEPPD